MHTLRNRLLMNVFLCLFTLFCTSCDVPIEMPFEKKNLAWSSDPNSDYHYLFKSCYCTNNGRLFAILHWKGRGQLGGSSKKIILCMDKKSLDSETNYELKDGILLSMLLGDINLIQIIRDEKKCLIIPLSGNKLKLQYDGKVSSKSYPAYDFEPHWLRFSIVAKEDKGKVIKFVRELIPQLEQRENTSEILELIRPLVNESEKPERLVTVPSFGKRPL